MCIQFGLFKVMTQVAIELTREVFIGNLDDGCFGLSVRGESLIEMTSGRKVRTWETIDFGGILLYSRTRKMGQLLE